MRRRLGLLNRALIAAALATATWTATAQYGASNGEWLSYGGDSGSTKYSPLDQINRDNVGTLQVAWTWASPDAAIRESAANSDDERISAIARTLRGRSAVTPLMAGGVLYVSTALSQVAAIDAGTGETIWVYDPESWKAGRPTNLGFTHRGVAYWTDGDLKRIFIGTGDARLIAIDAATGRPVSGFGNGGSIDLTVGIPYAAGPRPGGGAGNYSVTSPPIICRDVVVVGASISDGPVRKEAPRGDIRGFDVRTGELLWTFHSVPQQGEFGNETWEDGSWEYTGNANVWTMMSADQELGYVYLPFGTPTNDWYGGHRLGDNLFAESLVCIDVETGERVWHFQTVHHGLWDYDNPAAPVLCDITVDGKEIKAVAQISKQGFTYVLDRVTGEPVWPIEEREVPPSTVPGERASKTQPFPTKPPAFERQGSTEDNLIDWTDELRAEAVEILNEYVHGPLFTPPSEKGTINLPGWGGGANWSGAAFDPETGMLYIPSSTSPIVVKLGKPDPNRSNFNFIRSGGGLGGGGLRGPRGLPLFKPPYSRITAIDLNRGEHAWQIPHGDGQRERISSIVGRDVGPMGSPGGTGPLLTKTLLFFGQGAGGSARIAAAAPSPEGRGRGERAGRGRGRGGRGGRGGGGVLRAFDRATGEVIAEIKTPARPGATPMTYMWQGKQYIVFTAGDGLMAMSLP